MLALRPLTVCKEMGALLGFAPWGLSWGWVLQSNISRGVEGCFFLSLPSHKAPARPPLSFDARRRNGPGRPTNVECASPTFACGW